MDRFSELSQSDVYVILQHTVKEVKGDRSDFRAISCLWGRKVPYCKDAFSQLNYTFNASQVKVSGHIFLHADKLILG